MYVVTEYTGMDKEEQVFVGTFKTCCEYTETHYHHDEIESLKVDILRVNSDGTCTSDY